MTDQAATPALLAPSTLPAMVVAVATRPDLWLTALATMWRLAPRGWWRRRPYLPLPDGRYWSFRMVTAYGRPEADPVMEDVVSYLEWCRSAGSVFGRRARAQH